MFTEVYPFNLIYKKMWTLSEKLEVSESHIGDHHIQEFPSNIEKKEDLLCSAENFQDDIKNEPLDNDHCSGNSVLKLEHANKSTKNSVNPLQYEQISVKGYTLDYVKEDPIDNISSIYKENFLHFEKYKFHQEVFDEIVGNMSQIKISELEKQYIEQLRRAAKLKIFNCSSCQYQTMHKTNIRLHLVVIHKTEIDNSILKCLQCSYTCKSSKYMQKHVSTHQNIQSDSEQFNNDRYSSDNDEDLVLKKPARITRSKKKVGRNSIRYTTTRLKKHVENIHESDKEVKVWYCDLCTFQTGDRDSFSGHKQSHKCSDNMKKFICYKCDYQSLDKVKLKKHLLKVHDIITKGMESIKILKCEFCDYETDLIRSLQVHSLSHKNPDEIFWYQCNKCEFKTKFKKSYTEHQIRHKNPEEIVKSFMCEFCSYKCRTKGSLKKHILTHKPPDENTKWFKCPECDHKTKSKSHLKVHSTVHKNPSEIKMYICEICGLQSRRKWNYQMHLLTHKNSADVEIFRCTVCNYKTKFKDRLKRHLKKGHHGGRGREGKLQKCSICNFECRNRKVYCRHVMSHKTEINQIEGAYVCDVCGFKTMYNSSFSKHKKTHKSMDEVQTFKCPECDYRTKFKGNLKHHINTHKDPSEITMYKCDTCGIQFRRKENLNVHLLLHKSPDEVEMIKCSLCSYQTKFRAYMTTHLKKTHKIATKKNEYKDYTTVIDPHQQISVNSAI